MKGIVWALCCVLLMDNASSFGMLPIARSTRLVSRTRRVDLQMMFGGIAGKMGSIVELVSGQTTITENNIEDTLQEVKGILIDADVNLQVTNTLIRKVKEKAVGMSVEKGRKPGEQFISLLAAELVEIMGAAQAPLSRRSDGRPNTILMLGLQGAGKTTAAAKLASWALKQKYGQKILLVAADVYRPAAIDQLVTLGERLGVEVYSEKPATEGEFISPVQICRRAFKKATAEGFDTVIFDTAGRQVVDNKLMQELKEIKNAIVPDEALLVVDAMTGQEAATLTAKFNEDIGITGAILTKMDGDTRGGSALSVRGVSGKPIKFVGVGEGMDDLEPFYPERMASRILGMGDVQTLLEKAQSALDNDKATLLGKKMQKGNFDFNDYLLQVQTMKNIGGMGSMLKMIPGMAGKVSEEQIFALEKRIKKAEEIVSAMTAEERADPQLIVALGGKKQLVQEAYERRGDLARRTGYAVQEIEEFVMEFNGMRKMMQRNLKGMDLDAMNEDGDVSLQSNQPTTRQEMRKAKKVKPSRGGGGGFGAVAK